MVPVPLTVSFTHDVCARDDVISLTFVCCCWPANDPAAVRWNVLTTSHWIEWVYGGVGWMNRNGAELDGAGGACRKCVEPARATKGDGMCGALLMFLLL
ncbi:hypothetical protein E2C01_046929 [Portunus trituberculatus]|uniref:Uncharacterized protein n=1 Tax=Portunus trituberculatus TaxID=210409 RepID=A0A5B7G6J3_PORTR|nr:hypothetical protein [Portunus trituberculatus]